APPNPGKRAVELVVASGCPVPGRILLLASPQAADFILAWQAEREERASGLQWTQAETGIGEDDVARADIDAAAGHGGSGPHGRQLDLAQLLAGRGIESDQLAAHQGCEVDNAIGDRDAGGHGVTDVFEDWPGWRAADGCHLGTVVTPVLLLRIQTDGHDAPAGWMTAVEDPVLRSHPNGIDTVGVHALAIGGT